MLQKVAAGMLGVCLLAEAKLLTWQRRCVMLAAAAATATVTATVTAAGVWLSAGCSVQRKISTYRTQRTQFKPRVH